jgi:hypothetical protein
MSLTICNSPRLELYPVRHLSLILVLLFSPLRPGDSLVLQNTGAAAETTDDFERDLERAMAASAAAAGFSDPLPGLDQTSIRIHTNVDPAMFFSPTNRHPQPRAVEQGFQGSRLVGGQPAPTSDSRPADVDMQEVESSASWVCSQCTLNNDADAPVCAACTAPRD